MSESHRHMQKTLVKNQSGGGQDEADLRHHKAPPSASVPAGMDAHEGNLTALEQLSTDELRARAGQLAIEGHEQMERRGLIDALVYYRERNLGRLH